MPTLLEIWTARRRPFVARFPGSERLVLIEGPQPPALFAVWYRNEQRHLGGREVLGFRSMASEHAEAELVELTRRQVREYFGFVPGPPRR